MLIIRIFPLVCPLIAAFPCGVKHVELDPHAPHVRWNQGWELGEDEFAEWVLDVPYNTCAPRFSASC